MLEKRNHNLKMIESCNVIHIPQQVAYACMLASNSNKVRIVNLQIKPMNGKTNEENIIKKELDKKTVNLVLEFIQTDKKHESNPKISLCCKKVCLKKKHIHGIVKINIKNNF